MTLQERISNRKLLTEERFAEYRGDEHDLFLSLPDFSTLQSHFTIYFDTLNELAPRIVCYKRQYVLDSAPLLTQDRGYLCVHGKRKGSKGLHKIPLHRLAYTAFYGVPPVGYHIHHIDHNKHNNAADNLVALTEEEHCQVHGRDVSIPRSLFTKQKPKGLIAYLQPRK